MNIETWTILIYANGNNELEPEITKVIEKLKIENIKENGVQREKIFFSGEMRKKC